MRKILGIPIRTYVLQGWLKLKLPRSIPYAFLLVLTDKYWHAGNLISFFAQIATVLPAYVICVTVVFRSEARSLFLKWQASRLGPGLIASYFFARFLSRKNLKAGSGAKKTQQSEGPKS